MLQAHWERGRGPHRRIVCERNCGAGVCWAYLVCAAGLRHESTEEWWNGARSRGETFGWDRTPADLTTWAELTNLIGHGPRRANLIAWAESRKAPDHWRDLYRPYELWPDPDGWHPSYIDGDHERPGWDERIAAWRIALAVLDDAAARIEKGQLP